MGIRLSGWDDDGVLVWRFVERGRSELQRKLPLWNDDERTVSRKDEPRAKLRFERLGTLRYVRERKGVVFGLLRRVPARGRC